MCCGQDLVTDAVEAVGPGAAEVCRALLMETAEYDAYCLHETLTSRPHTDDVILNGILATRSHDQLNAIQRKYKQRKQSTRL